VERQNLEGLYAGNKAVEGGPGRAAIAPEILFALWLFATLEGVGSTREIERLTEQHDAYRWIVGGVRFNYHTLADFRSLHGEFLDELLSETLAGLMAVGVVKLKALAQEGMRVRAGAGASSFRRQEKLEGYLEVARQRIVELKGRQGKKPEEARASSTDAEATVMKRGDGGFRPAYNVQYGTEVESRVIVGVEGVTSGSDPGQRAPMVEQVGVRCGPASEPWLVDVGYPGHDPIDAVAGHTEVLAPVPKAKAKGEAGREEQLADPYAPKPVDSPAVIAWRQRMATEEAKRGYRARAASAECVNAQARNRGLQRLPVRDLGKVKGVALPWRTT
jgi:hypothetical protein